MSSDDLSRRADGDRVASRGRGNSFGLRRYGSAIHLFCTLGPSVEAAHEVATEHLSKRYAMDFREPARRYAALGRPADVAAKISEYIKAGAREIGVDAVCDPSDRDAQLEQFAKEVIPLLRP